ncbi:MAG: type II toxin-antitoxin system VapC family toxin [Nitrospirota bacterium]|nr:type II toxin-antitoxin system VapC family toxin [Nitrospirota bacterium]
MKVLLDTCTFLWIITDNKALSSVSRDFFSDPSHEIFLSAISVWEMLVKFSLGKIQLPTPVDQFIPQQRERHGIGSLSLEEASTGHLPKLPLHHRDPFDRMLICQAIQHELTILTPDPLITQYAIRTVWKGFPHKIDSC